MDSRTPGTPNQRWSGVSDAVSRVDKQLDPAADLEVVVINDRNEIVVHLRRPSRTGTRSSHAIYGSAFKPILAVTMLELAWHTGIDIDSPLSLYGVHFQDDRVTLRHLLEHRGGLPHIRDLAPAAADLADEDGLVRRIRRLPPQWPAGQVSAYHAISYSYALQAVCVDLGTDLAYEVRKLVLQTAGIADEELYLGGISSGEPPERRPSIVLGQSKLRWKQDGTALYHRSCYEIRDLIAVLNDWPTNRCAPLSCGVSGTALALAKFYAAVISSSDGGPFAPETYAAISDRPSQSMDRLLYQRVRWRCGFLEGAGLALEESGDGVIGMAGYGGSIGLCDLQSGVAMAVVTDQVDAGSVVGDAARVISQEVLDAATR